MVGSTHSSVLCLDIKGTYDMEIIKHVVKHNTQLCRSCGGEKNYFLQQSALIAKLYALTLES